MRDDVSIFALAQIGIPYRFGGSDTESGVDCSGLIAYVFQQVSHLNLPHHAASLARLGRQLEKPEEKGDLVYFNTLGKPYSHVGMYLGNNEFIHAPNRNKRVQIDSLQQPYYRQRMQAANTFFSAA